MKCLLLMLVLMPLAGWAATTSCSPTEAAVSNALFNASPGDTIIVTAGTWKASNAYNVVGVQLKAESYGAVTVEDYSLAANGTLLTLIQEDNNMVNLENFIFTHGINGTLKSGGTVNIKGTNGVDMPFSITRNQFNHVSNNVIRMSTSPVGSIDNNRFALSANTHAYWVHHDGWDGGVYGDGSWAGGIDLTGQQWVFVEDNVSWYTNTYYAVGDCSWAGRKIVRYNTITNGWEEIHGTDSSGRYRSGRATYYAFNNHYRDGVNDIGTGMVNCRGGELYMQGNVATGFNTATKAGTLAVYRDAHRLTSFGGANGTNEWDLTEAGWPFETATHTGSNGDTVLADSSQAWSTDQWVGYTILDTNSTDARFSVILANNGTTVTVKSVTTNFEPTGDMTFTNGLTYIFTRVLIALDQPGNGITTNSFSGDPPTPIGWPDQELAPVYAWNNTINGTNYNIESSAATVVEGTNFFNGSAPGWWVEPDYPNWVVTLRDGVPPTPVNRPGKSRGRGRYLGL